MECVATFSLSYPLLPLCHCLMCWVDIHSDGVKYDCDWVPHPDQLNFHLMWMSSTNTAVEKIPKAMDPAEVEAAITGGFNFT